MMKAECICQYSDDKYILRYRIIDEQYRVYDITMKDAERILLEGQIDIVNMHLNSSGVIVCKGVKHGIFGDKIERTISKYKLLGTVKELKTNEDAHAYLIKNVLYIPENIGDACQLNCSKDEFSKDSLVVKGGIGLAFMDKLFAECQIDKLDLSGLVTKNVISMVGLFITAI